MHSLGQSWLIVSMGLTAVAAGLLVARIIPAQTSVLTWLRQPASDGQSLEHKLSVLSMQTGIFALLWAVVVVLMIIRPGSSTGV
jgi:hypothetical protein